MNETIGNRIAKYRKAKSMTQEELASRLGVSSQAVSKWETDGSCPDISLLVPLCDTLGITTDELLTGKNDQVKLLPPQQRKRLEDLTLRVRILSSEGDKINVNLPMTLVKLCCDMGIEIAASYSASVEPLKKVDMNQIMALVECGAIGKLVEIESSEGDTIEVVVE